MEKQFSAKLGSDGGFWLSGSAGVFLNTLK